MTVTMTDSASEPLSAVTLFDLEAPSPDSDEDSSDSGAQNDGQGDASGDPVSRLPVVERSPDRRSHSPQPDRAEVPSVVGVAQEDEVPSVVGVAQEDEEPIDPWSAVPGQPDAVRCLGAAARLPVHAYLLVGPRGSGKRAAAAVFAGELLASADTKAELDPHRAIRHRRLAACEEHPDMFVLDPSGTQLRREDDAASLIAEAGRTPVEGDRKVLVVNRFHTANAAAAASLLKPVEEPAESVVWVLLAEQVRPEHATIASRCFQVRFAALTDVEIAGVLVAEGLADSEIAELAAAAAGGNLERAKLLVTDDQVAARRRAWWSIPERLDGTGAVVVALVEEVRDLISDAGAPLVAKHKQELAEIAERENRLGVRGSPRHSVDARHRRELRQHRTDELRFGLATLAGRYRQAMVGGDLRAMVAADRLRALSEVLPRNPNEALALHALLLDLPHLSGR